MAKHNRSLFLIVMVMALYTAGAAADESRYIFQDQGESYPYLVRQTGDNHTFEFSRNPGLEGRKLRAALHVLNSVYGDDSIKPVYSETFMKEGAMCFVFDSSFYTYRACFLPNDYSPVNVNRFWGFVSRVPNLMWIVTRNLLPATLFFGLFFLFPKRR